MSEHFLAVQQTCLSFRRKRSNGLCKKPSEIIQAIQDGLTTRREAIRHVAVDLDDEAKRDAAHALLGTIAKLDDAVTPSSRGGR